MLIIQIFKSRSSNPVAKLQLALINLQFFKQFYVRERNIVLYSQDIIDFDILNPKYEKREVIVAKQRKGKMSGEGETQIEILRRQTKMAEFQIQTQLKAAQERQTQHLKDLQAKKNLPSVALIGYTNAGKSAMMNAFAKKEIAESKDMLFQTLSNKTKLVQIQGNFKVLLIDTIGFVMDLHHSLIEPFKVTLEHLKYSDLILYV